MRKRRMLVATVVIVAAIAEALIAQDVHQDSLARNHPVHFARSDTDVGTYGHDWVAASTVLTRAGTVRQSGLNWRLREGLEWQLQRRFSADALEEGEIPATDASCAPHRMSRGFYVQEEQDGRFSSALLLSNVAVTATLTEGVPGFFANGNPGVLFALSDVVPLHAGSEPVDYVLVPHDRLVLHGRVFCAVTPSESRWSGRRQPTTGDQVVVMGARGEHGIVRTGALWGHLGFLALMDDEQTLHWDSGMTQNVGRPESLDALRTRVREAVSGGLLDVTSHLLFQEYGSPERVQFTRELQRYEDKGCRVSSAARSPDGDNWVARKLVCIP